MTEDRRRQIADGEEAALRAITMQDVRLAVGEGKLSAADVLAGCNAELRRRARLAYLQTADHSCDLPRHDGTLSNCRDGWSETGTEANERHATAELSEWWDRHAAAELLEWWSTGILRDGLVRAEAAALLASGKVGAGAHVRRAERNIVNRIVRRAALAQTSRKGFA